MSGITLCEPTVLYNILNQKTGYPCLSDPNYLLLLDARKKNEYNESHVITAKKAPKDQIGNFVVPYDAELECKQCVIVYDSNTDSLNEEGEAHKCAQVMSNMGSRHPVNILKGGYEDFSALYPFLRTQKIMFMPRELDNLMTYPLEVIPGLLYVGDWMQGNCHYIQKDLKIMGHINCSVPQSTHQSADNCHIPIEDTVSSDLFSRFHDACAFIDRHKAAGEVVLVFSEIGISRCACVAIAYLMHNDKTPLKEAYKQINRCSANVRPNRGFIEQLSRWEEKLMGQRLTDISDPNL